MRRPPKTTAEIKPGQFVSAWHDNGLGGSLIYFRVLKVGPKMIQVIGERLRRKIWRYPQWFDQIYTREQMLACGFSEKDFPARFIAEVWEEEPETVPGTAA